MKKEKSFKDAEAIGQIKTLPEIEVEMDEEMPEQSVAVIDTPEKLQAAIGNAQMDGLEHIEVEEKLFKFLVKNSPTAYLTYGNPGIKVYKKGTVDDLKKLEKMSAEQYHDYMSKKAKDGMAAQ